jgi:hypothetical protein
LYDEEHPLEIALAAMIAGFICGIYVLVKLGGFDAKSVEARLNKHHTPMHQSPESD